MWPETAEPASPAPSPERSALLRAAWNGVFSALPFLFSSAVAQVESWLPERRPRSQHRECDGRAWHRGPGLQSNVLIYDGRTWWWGWGRESLNLLQAARITGSLLSIRE